MNETRTNPEREPRGAAEVAGRAVTSAERHEAPSLLQLGWTLLDGKWTVLAIALGVLGLAVAHLVVATPLYRSTLMLQVEDGKRSLAGLEDLSTWFVTGARTEAEMEILRSRPLLEGVVSELGLDVSARPKRFPVFGAAVARRWSEPQPAPARFGPARFAWGGERIALEKLEVPDALLGQELTLTVREAGAFELTAADGRRLLTGAAGQAVSADGVELYVTELVARPGSEMILVKRRAAAVVDQLVADVKIEQKGRDTGLIVMSLEGAHPERTAAILNALAARYLKQNLDRTSAEAARALAFVESQLPVLRRNVAEAEADLNRFQRRSGTVNVGLQSQSTLARRGEIERALAALELQEAELHQRYSDDHPDLVAIQARADRLRNQRTAVEAQLSALPELELESARLGRNVDAARQIYGLLQNKAQELRILKSGSIGNVRVVEAAVIPHKPFSPNGGAVLPLALLVGLVLGGVGAFARRQLADGAEDPDDVESGVGLPVLATVPRSRAQSRAGRREKLNALSIVDPDDVAVEDLRGLRTTLQFALQGARNNVVTLGGPSPRIGKSFVSVNLAHLFASAGKRILVVDGDLRRGLLNRYFGVERQPGLSDVVAGTATLDAAIRKTEVEKLDFLPTGALPPNPAELLASPAFQALLQDASSRYDAVIVDTPPILAVTDAALIARHAGVNLLVLRAGEHPVREISLAMKRLGRSGAVYYGAILNEVRTSRGRYGRYGRYRRFDRE